MRSAVLKHQPSHEHCVLEPIKQAPVAPKEESILIAIKVAVC